MTRRSMRKLDFKWSRSPGKTGSQYDPNSDLFVPNERKDIITSTVCWITMVGLLVGLSCTIGLMQVLKLYGVPYWIFVMRLDFVTYLHQHGHEEKLPWYRGKLEISKRLEENKSQLYEIEGTETLGSCLGIISCTDNSPYFSRSSVQWYHVSPEAGKREVISGATKLVYDLDSFDV